MSVHVAPEGGAELVEVPRARAVPGRGLEGDRYFRGNGTWTEPGRWNEVTLVAEEALARAGEALGRSLGAAHARRNLVTRGVELNSLVGRRFRVGPVVLFGERLCHPCGYLERLAGVSGLKAALEGSGGLRATIVEGGVIEAGDEIAGTDEDGEAG